MESQNTTQARPEQQTLAVREQTEDEIDLVELFYLLWGHMLQIWGPWRWRWYTAASWWCAT